MEVNLYKDKIIGLFGLGITGISTYKSLIIGGAKVIAWDDNKDNREAFLSELQYNFNRKLVESSLIPLDSMLWKEMDILVISPGVPTDFPKPHKVVEIAKKAGAKIICDIELLYKSNPFADIIGITGTNGKSTVTSLLGHILKNANISSQVGGNIGDAVLSLEKLRAGGKYVVECSSFQLELLEDFKPKISILLNITPDHLDRYKSMDDYIKAKLHIFKNQNQSDIAIIGVDNDITRGIYKKISTTKQLKKIIPISVFEKLKDGAYFVGNKIIYKNVFKIKLSPNKSLLGDHNKENILASVVAAYYLGVDISSIEKSLSSYIGLKHRMEYLGTKNGVEYINDSKATNIESAIKALSSYKNIIWIAGGSIKGGEDFSKILPYLKNIKKVMLIGQSSDKLAEYLTNKISYKMCKTLKNAFDETQERCKKGDVVLLSPAFASFDQFKNFSERGEKFRELFLNL